MKIENEKKERELPTLFGWSFFFFFFKKHNYRHVTAGFFAYSDHLVANGYHPHLLQRQNPLFGRKDVCNLNLLRSRIPYQLNKPKKKQQETPIYSVRARIHCFRTARFNQKKTKQKMEKKN